jgi:hypothetical protein
LGWSGFFLAHRRLGFFHVGRDWFRFRGWVIEGGTLPRRDAADGEVWCRLSFRWSFPLFSLIWLRDPDYSTLWTGREYRLIGYQTRTRRVFWG